jgi:tetratricopeptide (TPR) repeat protein
MMKIKSTLFLFLIASSFCVYGQSLPVIIQNGTAKLAGGDNQGAEIDFANAIRLNDAVTSAYLDKLKKYGTMNEYQKSTSDMPDGFIYNHDFAVPYYGHGMALEGLGKQDDALLDFEKAIAIDPKYSEALCERGIVLISKGVKDKGCMDLRKAKALKNDKAKDLYDKNACSGMSVTFISAGDAKFSSKDYTGALTDYTSAIQLNADSIEPFIKRAACNVALKKYDKAVLDYNKALKIKSDTVQILFLRGSAYNAASNFKLAFEDFSAVIRISANYYEAYMQRAFACEGLENYRSATYDYGEAIRIKPKDGMAYYKRGVANQDSKDDSACKDFKIAASLGNEEAKSLADNCGAPAKKK